jgi:hypothetical protein
MGGIYFQMPTLIILSIQCMRAITMLFSATYNNTSAQGLDIYNEGTADTPGTLDVH